MQFNLPARHPTPPPGLPRRVRALPWRTMGFEVALIVLAYFAYFAVRGLTQGAEGAAFANAAEVVTFEQTLGILHEAALQDALLTGQGAITVANWIYIYGHWPFIAVVASWLLITRPAVYRRYRNAFLISGGAGLVIFALYPVAPPRFLDLGLNDTVTEYSRSYRVLQPQSLTNLYAAVPSLHFGWNLLIGIALFKHARHLLFRAVGVLSPLAMAFAVVVTGNHYFVDIVAGGALALLGFAVAVHGGPYIRFVTDRLVIGAPSSPPPTA